MFLGLLVAISQRVLGSRSFKSSILILDASRGSLLYLAAVLLLDGVRGSHGTMATILRETTKKLKILLNRI